MNRFIILFLLTLHSCSSFKPKSEYDTNILNFSALTLVNTYKNDISPADGPRSGSLPTGSAYGKQAFERYGFLLGIILTFDRLLHETSPNRSYLVNVGDRKFKNDPIDYNVYWWDKKVIEKYQPY